MLERFLVMGKIKGRNLGSGYHIESAWKEEYMQKKENEAFDWDGDPYNSKRVTRKIKAETKVAKRRKNRKEQPNSHKIQFVDMNNINFENALNKVVPEDYKKDLIMIPIDFNKMRNEWFDLWRVAKKQNIDKDVFLILYLWDDKKVCIKYQIVFQLEILKGHLT